jgi:hypothetical protein
MRIFLPAGRSDASVPDVRTVVSVARNRWPPRPFFAFLSVMTLAYLAAVEIAKRRFYRDLRGT